MTTSKIHNSIVIGAGAAGLFFGASPDSSQGGIILEGNGLSGRKLLMSGGGQCNITHSGSVKDFVSCYNTGKIRSCLYRFNNDRLRDFLKSGGVNTAVREYGKVFPESMKAEDVLNMLLGLCEKNGFSVMTSHKVTGISREPSGLWQVTCGSRQFTGRNVIIACGGCSYPSTGSDGSIFRILREDPGLEITRIRPALVPVAVRDYPFEELAGISFPEAHVRILEAPSGKVRAESRGPLLLTHRDFSGPAVLNISKYGESGDMLEINYTGKTHEEIRSRLNDVRRGSRKSMASDISDAFELPARFCKILEAGCGSSVNRISKTLCSDTYTIKDGAGFGRAMVTSGGVSLSELDTKTFRCKKHKGLYVIGESCDVDGVTGGYNLQFAFSSAFAAAEAIRASD